MNLMMLMEMAATADGDRVAVGSESHAITYRQFSTAAAALAGRLKACDARYLVVCDETSPALITALFGAAWAGVPYVPLNYRLTDADTADLAARTRPALALVGDGDPVGLGSTAGIETIERSDLLADLIGARAENEAGLVPTDHPAEVGPWPNDPDAIAVLLYTSGTTGPPKSAVLRHRHLVSYIFGVATLMSANSDEASLIAVPPYHVAGVAIMLSQLYVGRRIVFMPRFDPDGWIDLVLTERVTHAMVVPTMLARIVDALDRRGETITSLRGLSYGGGRTHPSVVERALELFPETDFVNAYGLTETSATVALLGPDDHRRAAAATAPEARARLASVGRAIPSVDISIRDGVGVEVEPGGAGEIWVRGQQVAGEYLQGGSRLDGDGWFATRDSGYTDEDGYLYVLGRNDDIIIRGGENMSPGEIEDVLLSHDWVRDAAAVGVPSRQWGEEVAVFVVASEPAPTPSELRDLVRSRLRSSRVPSRVVFVDELPYNETGKILRRVLRDRLTDLSEGHDQDLPRS